MRSGSPFHLSLGSLIEEWSRAPELERLVRELELELEGSAEAFVGRPLPEAIVRGRLPPPVASAWVFVLRSSTRNPAHVHPNSTQFTAAIRGGGRSFVGGLPAPIELFEPSRADSTLHVFAPGTPHAFEPGCEPLVVISFHTVAAQELVEIEVESGAARRYVGPPTDLGGAPPAGPSPPGLGAATGA
jgi:hypothetical protein